MRPHRYETPEQLQAAIDEYFSDPDRVLTISGLVYHLGYADRRSFYDLEKQEKFSHTIKRARLRIETMYEELLPTKSCAGAIFALKNFGWTDKQTIEHEGSKEKPVTFVLDERFTNS